jgi:ribonuclease J
MGANVIYESVDPVHVSGHAYQEELKMMINLTRPYYLAPVHGEPRHQHLYLEMVRDMGYPESRIFMLEDGQPLCMDETTAWVGEPVPSGRVLVDNSGRPGISDEILRDRSNLANDGIVVVTIALDMERGEIVGDPVIQAKGFSGTSELLDEASGALADALAEMAESDIKDIDAVRHTASDVLRRQILRRTQLRPLVVPTVIEI